MGLDMYAFTTIHKPKKPVDFKMPKEIGMDEIHYWRKHPNLHGWMEQLYRTKGGANPSFNCVPVILTLEDLNALEAAVQGEVLPDTTGFFFGESEPEDKVGDLEFIAKARTAIGALS